MSKIKSFLAKPFTWGGYLKLCAGVYAISIAIMGGYLAWFTHGITWGRKTTEDKEEEEPAYSWTDED